MGRPPPFHFFGQSVRTDEQEEGLKADTAPHTKKQDKMATGPKSRNRSYKRRTNRRAVRKGCRDENEDGDGK
jgi:hypothetical protein